MSIWNELQADMSQLMHQIMFIWNRLHAEVSIFDRSHNETLFPSIQNLKFRPLIDTIECELVGKTY